MEHWMGMLRQWGGHEPAQILIIIIAAWMAYELIRHLVPRISRLARGQDRFYALPWIPLLRLIILLTALTLIVPVIIEPTRENVLALVGASALAIGFAIKDYISCLIAGIIFMFERPYRVGDWIQIGETYGEVVHLGLRAVLIRTTDANDITIPHSTLWHDQLSNATSGAHDLLCIADFYVHPDHDNALARQVLFDVAMTSIYLHLDRPIVIIMKHLPFGLYYKLKAYPMEAREQFKFISDLSERGQFALHDIGLRMITAPQAVMAHG